jgi:hypothetical protein
MNFSVTIVTVITKKSERSFVSECDGRHGRAAPASALILLPGAGDSGRLSWIAALSLGGP